MDNFQWDEIKKIFDFMDWKYASSPNPDDDYLPEIHHLKELVTELLETVTANSTISYISSSGRFQAKWNADDELLSLSFIPYEDLTKDIVSTWLESNVDMGFVNNFIKNNLQNAFSPPVISLPLPF